MEVWIVPSEDVKKTITPPADLATRLQAATRNLSAVVAEACQEKLPADARRAREREMIERCRVRYVEDVHLAGDFFEAEQQAWGSAR